MPERVSAIPDHGASAAEASIVCSNLAEKHPERVYSREDILFLAV